MSLRARRAPSESERADARRSLRVPPERLMTLRVIPAARGRERRKKKEKKRGGRRERTRKKQKRRSKTR